MNLYVGVTDKAWWTFLKDHHAPDANFWRPSGKSFKALGPGKLFLFKLHAPENVVVGGGYFISALVLPLITAWEVFGEYNGVADLKAYSWTPPSLCKALEG